MFDFSAIMVLGISALVGIGVMFGAPAAFGEDFNGTGLGFIIGGVRADILDGIEDATNIDDGDREIICLDDFKFAGRNAVCRADI